MIASFRSKGLQEVFQTGRSKRLRADQLARIVERLTVLNGATTLVNVNVPGYKFHPLKGTPRYAISVSGAWRITFGWDGHNATEVDLEQYH